MTKTVHFVAAAFATILVCSVGQAQRRGGVSSMRMPSTRAASSARVSAAVSPAIRQVRYIQKSPAGQVTLGFSSFGNSAGLARAFRNYPPSNRIRGGRGGPAVFVPILYNGYPYYVGDYYGDSSNYDQPQQPQPIADQQPVPVAQQPDDSANYAPASPMPPPVTPVRDVGEFVLVRRDGQILFASAFMVGTTQLTYINLEGIRRTLPLAELDADATQQMNEARGTTVQIHN